MNLRHSVLAAVMFVAINAEGAGKSPQPRDGNWWRLQDRPAKMFYLAGVFDGLRNAQWMRQISGAPKTDKWDIGPVLRQAFTNRTGEQLVDGVDVFFENFANRSISVPGALFMVCAMIAGASEKDIKPAVEALRRGASDEGSPSPTPSHK